MYLSENTILVHVRSKFDNVHSIYLKISPYLSLVGTSLSFYFDKTPKGTKYFKRTNFETKFG